MEQRSIDSVDPWKFYYLEFWINKEIQTTKAFSLTAVSLGYPQRQNTFSLRSGVSAL